MARNVKVSTIQLPLEYKERSNAVLKKAQVANALKMFEQAGRTGSDIALAGEVCNILFCRLKSKTQRLKYAERVPGPTVKKFQRLAEKFRMHIVLPVAALIDGVLRNTALVIDRKGKIIGRYDKVHLTRLEAKNGFVPGDTFPVFDLDFGRIGIMICHDNSFVESARILGLKGAEIIFWPHIQGGWGEVMWNITLASRAIDNCCYIVSSSYGLEKGRAWTPGMAQGRSGIVRWDGHVVADCGRRIGIATATIDLDDIRYAHNFTLEAERPFRDDMLGDRRPECYGMILKPKNKLPKPFKKGK